MQCLEALVEETEPPVPEKQPSESLENLKKEIVELLH